jgi:hypothetical protein
VDPVAQVRSGLGACETRTPAPSAKRLVRLIQIPIAASVP